MTTVSGDDVVLTVTDDGRGLPDDVHESGVGNMRNRAENLGGSLSLESGPGAGTRVCWRVPASASSAR